MPLARCRARYTSQAPASGTSSKAKSHIGCAKTIVGYVFMVRRSLFTEVRWLMSPKIHQP